MKTRHGVNDVTPAGANIFEDLGFDFNEAVNMKHRADLAIALLRWIDEKELNQQEAALMLGVKRPEISNLKRGKLMKISIDKLIKMLHRAGKTVTMEIS